MSSQTLLSEVLDELRSYNPHASPSEISAGLIAVMEKEILPRVLQNLDLPKFPSWAEMSIKEKAGRQAKKIRPTKSLEKRRMIIQQIEYMRRRLSWDGGNTLVPTPCFLDAGSRINPPELSLSSTKGLLDYDREKIIKVDKEDDPYTSLSAPSKMKYQIIFSENFQKKILSDTFVEEVFRRIEVSIRELVEARGLETNIDVSLRVDFEIPSWEKYVITIGFPAQVDFRDRTKIWAVFDIIIRKRIAELAEKADPNTKEYLKNLNKKLLVHIEL